jgi:hypothetical protein
LLVGWLGQYRGMVLVVIDDLQWADGPSARALLFAVRRLQADQVLVVVSARTGGLCRVGEGLQRFLAGDHRSSSWAGRRPGSGPSACPDAIPEYLRSERSRSTAAVQAALIPPLSHARQFACDEFF